ncbi:hypothetical protein EHO61_10200 [Leptospira fluminis]|uniref:Yip1 domain-containing protein n=1 Tax=Leptospira fluminis TaxID=2484979 RepID=A0A4R9GN09_9LEPT|nr:hypothetical protein [Leptospira fluminis]TGK17839.1 hypothetical protein EHO61_10200 [Leptospira fluminis]
MNVLEKLKLRLKDNLFTRAFLENLEFNLRPKETLSLRPKDFLIATARIYLLFLGAYVLSNVFVSLFNLGYLNEFGDRMREYYEQGRIGWAMYAMNSFPFNIFLMAAFSILFQLYSATTSYAALWILGEPDRSFARMLGIAFSTGTYFLLAFFPILISYNLVPQSVQKDTFKMSFFLGLNAAFLILAITAQCIFYVRMCRSIFQQNFGRAILTWLGPFLFFVIVLTTNL